MSLTFSLLRELPVSVTRLYFTFFSRRNFKIFHKQCFNIESKFIIEIVLYACNNAMQKQLNVRIEAKIGKKTMLQCQKNITWLLVGESQRSATLLLLDVNHPWIHSFNSGKLLYSVQCLITSNLYLYINENLLFVHGHFHSFTTDSSAPTTPIRCSNVTIYRTATLYVCTVDVVRWRCHEFPKMVTRLLFIVINSIGAIYSQ